jgi:hypothetical protein
MERAMSIQAWILVGFALGAMAGATVTVWMLGNQKKRTRARRSVPPAMGSLPARLDSADHPTPPKSHDAPRRIPRGLRKVKVTTALDDGTSIQMKLAGGAAALMIIAATAYKLVTALTGSPVNTVASGPPVQVVNQNSVSVNVTEEVRRYLDSVLVVEGDGYKIRRYFRQNLVEELNGTWYEIDLRNARRTGRLLFAPGKYALDEVENTSLKEIMGRVQDEVLKAGVMYQLFVRGSADLLGADAAVIDTLQTQQPLRITYLPRKPSDANVYARNPVDSLVPVHFNNQHLPFLRGGYMRDRLRDASLPAQILEGVVSRRIDEQDRNVEVFLFLPATD